MDAALLVLGWVLDVSFLGWAVVDLAGVLEDLGVEVEGLDGAVVGFLGVVVCLFVVVGGGLVFLGGSLGRFFFCSGIIIGYLLFSMRIRECLFIC